MSQGIEMLCQNPRIFSLMRKEERKKGQMCVNKNLYYRIQQVDVLQMRERERRVRRITRVILFKGGSRNILNQWNRDLLFLRESLKRQQHFNEF